MPESGLRHQSSRLDITGLLRKAGGGSRPLNCLPSYQAGSCLVGLDFSFSPSVPLTQDHCVPRGHLAISEDMSGSHNLGFATGILRMGARDAAEHPTGYRMPRNRE